MEAGKLRNRVTIERQDRAENSLGEMVTTWATVATVWAAVEPRSSFRREQAAQTIGTVTHDVSLRYTPLLTPDCRLTMGGRVFQLVGPPINVGERNAELRMSVVEVPAGG